MLERSLGNPLQPPEDEQGSAEHDIYRVEVISRLLSIRSPISIEITDKYSS
jgi:hypothetical protein